MVENPKLYSTKRMKSRDSMEEEKGNREREVTLRVWSEERK